MKVIEIDEDIRPPLLKRSRSWYGRASGPLQTSKIFCNPIPYVFFDSCQSLSERRCIAKILSICCHPIKRIAALETKAHRPCAHLMALSLAWKSLKKKGTTGHLVASLTSSAYVHYKHSLVSSILYMGSLAGTRRLENPNPTEDHVHQMWFFSSLTVSPHIILQTSLMTITWPLHTSFAQMYVQASVNTYTGVHLHSYDQEWLVSTPIHIQLYKAFGWDPPQYAHIGLLLDTESRKLSKRANDPTTDLSAMQVDHLITLSASRRADCPFIL